MIIGKGDPDRLLNNEQITALCDQALSHKDLNHKRILVIIPDHTRTGPIDVMFRNLYLLL